MSTETATLPTTIDPLARFVELEHERRRLEERLDQIKSEVTALSEVLIDQWLDRGQQNANVDGLCVYVATDFICSKKAGIPTEVICAALTSVGMGSMISPNYNAATLKAWAKEQTSGGHELPPNLKDLLYTEYVSKLRTRQS